MISQTIFLGAFGWTEIAMIAVVVLLLFGGKKIPELMKGLGGGLKEFKKAAGDDENSEKVTDKNSSTQENTPPVKEDQVNFKEKK